MTEDEQSLIDWFVQLPVELKAYLQAHIMYVEALLQTIPMDYIVRSRQKHKRNDTKHLNVTPISNEDIIRLRKYLDSLPKEE